MMKQMKSNKTLTMAALFTAALALSACAGMTPTEQRMLSGGAAGAAGGAALSGIAGGSPMTGAALGGAAGTAGGYLYDQMQQRR